jgi:hypothetical protein
MRLNVKVNREKWLFSREKWLSPVIQAWEASTVGWLEVEGRDLYQSTDDILLPHYAWLPNDVARMLPQMSVDEKCLLCLLYQFLYQEDKKFEPQAE